MIKYTKGSEQSNLRINSENYSAGWIALTNLFQRSAKGNLEREAEGEHIPLAEAVQKRDFQVWHSPNS